MPRSEVFFTQAENCYFLELEDVEPGRIQIELPELPHGVKFSSSKKEEFISASGKKGTIISLWFVFSETGETVIPPLNARIDGKQHFFEFERVPVQENPALISPKLEIIIEHKNIPVQDKSCVFQKGEKINLLVRTQYAVQVLSFKWNLPRNSIFSESRRFEFANGNEKLTAFTSDKKNLARFEWKILKEGSYALPDFSVEVLAFNGTRQILTTAQNIRITVTQKEYQKDDTENKASELFSDAFINSEGEKIGEKVNKNPEEYEKFAKSIKLSFFEKISGTKYAVFKGGRISQIPEEKSKSGMFEGGQKVKVERKTKNWSFITCEEFTGWTKNENLIEI
ncbi:MAG: hypothetical protein II821_08270 [Treponema sp.]|nr:hypothetical protein [Treponema sp.]